MSNSHSFRSRLFWGALIGAMGMLMMSHIIFLKLIRFSVIFRNDHAMIAGACALTLIGIGVLLVRRGLSPFDQLRSRLAGMREGKQHRIDGRYPAEVQPL